MTRFAPMIAAAVIIAACSPGASSSKAPTVTSTPVSTPSAPTVAASGQEPTLALGPDVIAEVVTTDLVMRAAPAVSPESIIYPGRLAPGDRLYLVEGPVSADGFDWYLGSPYEARVNEEADATSQVWVHFGWVAAAHKTGEAWIVPIEADCPPDATVEILSNLPFELRLACFGSGPISLDGDVTCPKFGLPTPAPQPDWLTWDACYLVPPGAPPYAQVAGPQQFIAIHYPPGAERLTGALRLSGHFNDPRSTECMFYVPTPEGDVYSQELFHRAQKLTCRASFVVDRAEPIGL